MRAIVWSYWYVEVAARSAHHIADSDILPRLATARPIQSLYRGHQVHRSTYGDDYNSPQFEVRRKYCARSETYRFRTLTGRIGLQHCSLPVKERLGARCVLQQQVMRWSGRHAESVCPWIRDIRPSIFPEPSFWPSALSRRFSASCMSRPLAASYCWSQ